MEQNISISYEDVQNSIDIFSSNSRKDYSECIQNLIKSKPFGNHKFYIYSILKDDPTTPHVRRYIHQPRLTRPEPVHGTSLLKADPENPEEVVIVWTLPDKEDFELFKEGKIFADRFIWDCIQTYKYNRKKFLEPDPDDLPEEKIREIYQDKAKNRIISFSSS